MNTILKWFHGVSFSSNPFLLSRWEQRDWICLFIFEKSWFYTLRDRDLNALFKIWFISKFSFFNGCQGWKTGLTKTPRSRRTRCVVGLSSGNRDINFQFYPPIMERFCSKLACEFPSSLMSISCSHGEIGIMLHFNTSGKWILNPLKLFI